MRGHVLNGRRVLGLTILLAACASPAPTREAVTDRDAATPRFAAHGPDAEAYGARAGYPKGDRITFFEVPWLVGTNSHLDEIFEGRLIALRPSGHRSAAVRSVPGHGAGERDRVDLSCPMLADRRPGAIL